MARAQLTNYRGDLSAASSHSDANSFTMCDAGNEISRRWFFNLIWITVTRIFVGRALDIEVG